MSEQAPPSAGDRPRTPARPATGTNPAAKKVAGARRPPATPARDEVSPRWLRVMAAWSWRVLVVVTAVSLVVWATSRVLLVFVAVFLALVFTAVLRPLVNLLARAVPRALATATSLVVAVAAIAGMFTYVGLSVAGQWENLAEQFNDGIATILDFLEASPLNLRVTADDVQDWLEAGQEWVAENSGAIASQAWAGAGSVALMFMVLALAVFCTVFFLTRGKEMWFWFLNQLPSRMRPAWHTGGDAAWYTFSGYTRGTFIIAAADGVLAAIALVLLGVPLAAPLAVLVFIGAFIPLIGAPLAMVIAMIVALAANGVLNAVAVGVVIALIGQFEGHVLQPLVMGKQVSLHPVVVALSVTGGTLVAGILGAVIAVPIVSVAWAVFSRLRTVEPPTDFSDDPPPEDPDGPEPLAPDVTSPEVT
ncbi:AI-2E family transporter [Cellulomonas bogoriensis]|uniref:Membrane protein n=1 Tax=Cellulomonas bogoriensis 69B4 = DSM 16987 TaxID=1386082 RepID=A0A0A0BZB2_9CELL|nr:AI-2E family transporter [Cellulomonas bogoriensis]KGM13236.1 membrane protein [Cellulomonas bogoriensis 69B4 = DSM 16987]